MDTAWIQVFVLSLSECVAPAGKTVCQEQQLELEFARLEDCETALEQLVELKEASATVIVDRDSARCVATARKVEVFTSLAAVAAANEDRENWVTPDLSRAEADFQQAAHQERLEQMPECSESAPVYPCRKGLIIVEEAPSREVEVWRQDPD